MDIIKVFKDAREILRKRGWGQELYYNEKTDCFCSVGAVREAIACVLLKLDPLAVKGNHWYEINKDSYATGHDATSTESEAWNLLTIAVKEPITYWNDVQGRTREEILSAFNAVVDKLERLRSERASDDGPVPE